MKAVGLPPSLKSCCLQNHQNHMIQNQKIQNQKIQNEKNQKNQNQKNQNHQKISQQRDDVDDVFSTVNNTV
ncbi:hypothetical protein BGX26_002395 [Mortierella sp. AD094]|nr:hypothetical protein BGX26_002395 [Mortierella sp. AD094]